MEKTKFGLIVVEAVRSARIMRDGYIIINSDSVNGELLQEIFYKFIVHSYNRKPIPTGFIKSVQYFSAQELNRTLTNERIVLARDSIFFKEQPIVFKTSDFNKIRTLCYH